MLLEFQTLKAWIISCGPITHFDELLFVFVAYWEGKEIETQPTMFSFIKFQNLETGKSEPRYLGIIACMRLYVIGISNIKGINH